MIFDVIVPIGILMILLLVYSFYNTKHKRVLEAYGYTLLASICFLFGIYYWSFNQSIAYSVLSVIGGFLSFYITTKVITGKLNLERTKVLIIISSSILLLIYSMSTMQHFLINLVASETSSILNNIGYATTVLNAEDGTYIVFEETSQQLRTEIILACTGVGSIAIFTGLSFAIDSLTRAEQIMLAFGSATVLFLLNIVRNVFIAGAYGGQWFHIAPEFIGLIFGRSDEWVSYYIADRIISQFGAVFVLGILAIFLIRTIGTDSKLFNELADIIDVLINDVQRYKS